MRRQTGGDGGGLGRGGQKGGLKEAFDAGIVEIEALVGPGALDGLDFEAIETAARRRALQVAVRAVERRLNAHRSDHVGPTLQCTSGKDARYAGRRDKPFTTVLGEMTLSRAIAALAPIRHGATVGRRAAWLGVTPAAGQNHHDTQRRKAA
jgi:hypothetical protein